MPVFSTYSHIIRVIITIISMFKKKYFWSFLYGRPTPNIGYTTRNVYIELQVRKDSLITFQAFSMFILQK